MSDPEPDPDLEPEAASESESESESDVPYRFDRTHQAAEVVETWSSLEPGDESGVGVAVAGRLMLLRPQGKVAFGELRDASGSVQLFALASQTAEFDAFVRLNLGDWIGAQGQVAWIFRRRRRPPWVSRAAAGRMRRGLRFRAGGGAVQGEQPEPGQQGRGSQGGGSRALFIASAPDGNLPMPQSFRYGWRLRPWRAPVGGVDVGELAPPAG